MLDGKRCYAKQESKKGLPWGSSDTESACQCRVHEFTPWFRRSPPTTRQLSPSATTTEAHTP